MELKQFITDSLRQILEGIAEAQPHAERVGGFVSPVNRDAARGHPGTVTIPGQGLPAREFHTVSFDVAVTVTRETETKGGAGVVTVLAAGVGRTQEYSTEVISRLKFDVPVVFPGKVHSPKKPGT